MADWLMAQRVGMLALTFAFGGCAAELPPACEGTEDCESGYVCYEQECLQVCSNSTDCVRADQKCEHELCRDVRDPECTSNTACDDPPACYLAATPTCLEGVCYYNEVSCTTPPADGCTGDDSTYLLYSSTGSCNHASGDCEYPVTEVACPDCAETCAPNPDVCVFYVDGATTSTTQDGQAWSTAFDSPQDALQAASSAIGGSCTFADIWVAQGTYRIYESSADDTLALVPNVRLYGGFQGDEVVRAQRNVTQNTTTLSGASADGLSRVYHVVTGANDAVLDGFTISDGDATAEPSASDRNGGGILNVTASPTIRNCRIEHNEASNGAGMYNADFAAPEIIDTVIANNLAYSRGGGMTNDSNALPYLHGVVFAMNRSYGPGGGMYNDGDATVFINHSVVVENDADGDGGGMMNENGGSWAHIRACLFTGNVGGEGGAINDWSGYPGTLITNSIFTANYAGHGSGVSVWDGAHPVIKNSLFAGNTAGSGILYASYAGVTVHNCTLVENVASVGNSGAIEIFDQGSLVLANSVLENNSPADVAYEQQAIIDGRISVSLDNNNLFGAEEPWLAGATATGTWSQAASYDGQQFQSRFTDESAAWAPDELVGLFIRPLATGTRFLPIVANSGQQITVWGDLSAVISSGTSYEIWDFRLDSGSPAIDAADAAYAPIYDLDGVPRVDATAANTGTGTPPYVDIGAYEYWTRTPSVSDWVLPGCSGASSLAASGHLYFLCSTGSVWTDARSFCEGYGLELATITSPEEQALISALSSFPMWMGGQNGVVATQWRWLTGEPWSYTSWGTGQPVSANSRCLALTPTGWEASYCSAENAFVCELTP